MADSSVAVATTLAVSGPVTRSEAEWWKGAMLDALSSGKPVRVDLAASGPWDVAGLQLILAAVRSGKPGGPAVTLARVPRVFLAIAERAGLAGQFGPEVVESLA